MALITNARWDDEADYVIVGSGASGATAALVLAEQGANVLMLEEGKWYRREDFKEPLFSAISTLFRDFGLRVAKGRSVIPVLEGRCVGGSTVMNGAIVHRFPEAIHAKWAKDPCWSTQLTYAEIDRCADKLDQWLGVRRNLSSLLPSLPVSEALQKLGWRHQAMLRNAPGCEGSGRCLQGCPTGGKYSMERSFIPRAMQAGARLAAEHKVVRLLFNRDNAEGVLCQLPTGKLRRVRAAKAIILAGGVLQTPQILWRSGYQHRHLGKHFQCHLGVGITGFLDRPAQEIEGPPQGIEVLQFGKQNIKLATQLIPPDLLLARTPLRSSQLVSWLEKANEFSSWTASVASEAQGTLKRRVLGASLHFSPTVRDMETVRKSLHLLAGLLFQLGAKKVFPGISGPPSIPGELSSVAHLEQLSALPLDPRHYWLSVGHLFGTCRLGSDSKTHVVSPTFSLNGTKKIYVVDASVFPTSLGVNPQHGIMSLAMKGAETILEKSE